MLSFLYINFVFIIQIKQGYICGLTNRPFHALVLMPFFSYTSSESLCYGIPSFLRYPSKTFLKHINCCGPRTFRMVYIQIYFADLHFCLVHPLLCRSSFSEFFILFEQLKIVFVAQQKTRFNIAEIWSVSMRMCP